MIALPRTFRYHVIGKNDEQSQSARKVKTRNIVVIILKNEQQNEELAETKIYLIKAARPVLSICSARERYSIKYTNILRTHVIKRNRDKIIQFRSNSNTKKTIFIAKDIPVFLQIACKRLIAIFTMCIGEMRRERNARIITNRTGV